MFVLDITMEDTRIRATGTGSCDENGTMPWAVEFHDNMTGQVAYHALSAKDFAELLHTMIADDGNGTSQFYQNSSNLLAGLKICDECRPIA